ncbi:MAG TPA: hypothetical protein VHQ02_09005 [Usitatibacter sp.]|jgi:hypothetical protein|nr:hypothetical protein [Usitatibacter sp.]
MNSTNVRIDAAGARSLFVALAAWAALVALGAADGVFTRLDPAVDGALAAFGAFFALAACCIDRSVGARVDRVPLALLAGIALGVDAALAATLAASGPLALLAGPGAFLAFFAAPVAIAAHAAVARRLAARLRSQAARSPAARPAST